MFTKKIKMSIQKEQKMDMYFEILYKYTSLKNNENEDLMGI